MGTPANLGSGGLAARPTWVTRNWKWAIPLGVLVLFVLLVAFIGGIFLLVETSFQHSEFYAQALARARSDPEVAAKIGRPLAAGWLASGSVHVENSSGNADLYIPISGPKGKGTLHVVAKKTAGSWTFETLQVEVAGESDRIDLLRPEGRGPGGA